MKKTEYISVRIDEEMKKTLCRIAEEEDRTLSQVIYRIIKDHLKENAGTT